MKIFVYGTLLKGMQRSFVLEASLFLDAAKITADLYDLGYYPGMKNGLNTVLGEVYQISESALEHLDRIEGYSEDNPTASLYLRQEVAVQTLSDGKEIQALSYFYNQSVDDSGTLILEGDYRRYLLEKESKEQWIIAYGSNLDQQRITDRIGRFPAYKKGFLAGYQLVFNKKALRKDTVYANVRYMGINHQCPAVAYLLSAEEINILDKREGTPNHYLRKSIIFTAMTGEQWIMQAYIANPQQLREGLLPEQNYLQLILKGYDNYGFDKKHLSNIVNSGSSKGCCFIT